MDVLGLDGEICKEGVVFIVVWFLLTQGDGDSAISISHRWT